MSGTCIFKTHQSVTNKLVSRPKITEGETCSNHSISLILISNFLFRATKSAAKPGRRRRYAEHAPEGLPWQNCGAHSAPGPVRVRKRETTKPSGVCCQVPHGTQPRINQWKVISITCLTKFSNLTPSFVFLGFFGSLTFHVNVNTISLKFGCKND